MSPESETIFSKIIRKQIPADIVYEDDHTLAFLDIAPCSPGHTLVIPKKFATNIFDVDDETLAHVWSTIRKIAPAVQDAVGAGGVNINSNHEAIAGQVVFHMHFHIIPRFEGDGLNFWPKIKTTPEEISAIAEKIRKGISA